MTNDYFNTARTIIDNGGSTTEAFTGTAFITSTQLISPAVAGSLEGGLAKQVLINTAVGTLTDYGTQGLTSIGFRLAGNDQLADMYKPNILNLPESFLTGLAMTPGVMLAAKAGRMGPTLGDVKTQLGEGMNSLREISIQMRESTPNLKFDQPTFKPATSEVTGGLREIPSQTREAIQNLKLDQPNFKSTTEANIRMAVAESNMPTMGENTRLSNRAVSDSALPTKPMLETSSEGIRIGARGNVTADLPAISRVPTSEKLPGSASETMPQSDSSKIRNQSGINSIQPAKSTGRTIMMVVDESMRTHPSKPIIPTPGERSIGCFVAGTLVWTKRGKVPIEELRIGELVLSQPERKGELELRPVEDIFVFEDKEIYRVTYANAQGQSESILATPNHPFFVVDDGWRAAEYIEAGHLLELQDGSHVTVLAVEDTGTLQRVYNFEVGQFHTYYVGEMGVWVHNVQCDLKKNAPQNYESYFTEDAYKQRHALKGENFDVSTPGEAITVAKQRAGITSRDPQIDRWEAGGDEKRRGSPSYIYTKDPARQGIYQVYKTSAGEKIVAIHMEWEEGSKKIPHAHAYSPNENKKTTSSRQQFIDGDYYDVIGDRHHIWIEFIKEKGKK